MALNFPLIPRHSDGVLRVVVTGRISTAAQDMRSIDSQHADAEAWLRSNYSGTTRVTLLGEQASGWLTNRETMIEAGRLIDTHAIDLYLVTELREVYRNPADHWRFVQRCVDHHVRFVSIADSIDTASDDWETNMHIASLRAGLAVPEIRRRVRRKATDAFQRGGMVMKVRFGYRKLTQEEAQRGQFGTPGLRIAKLPECEAAIRKMWACLRRGDSYMRIAELLNSEQVSPGPYSTRGSWTGRLVRDLLADPILSGRRRFRREVSRLVYSTGKHRAQPNPTPETADYPELAFLSTEEHDEVLPIMEGRRKSAAAGQRQQHDHPLYRRPRARSLFPGQIAHCGICGSLMYRFGDALRCANAVPNGPRTCWNLVQVPFSQVFQKVLPWIAGVLEGHPAARRAMASSAWTQYQADMRVKRRHDDEADKRVPLLEKQASRLAKALAAMDESDAILAELTQVEAELHATRQRSARKKDDVEEHLADYAEFERKFANVLPRMAKSSLDFADLLRQLVRTFVIDPVQALDCSQVRPRARLELNFDAWASEGKSLQMSTTIDLFDPPVHVSALNACEEARNRNPKATLRQIAAEVGVGYMTVKRALRYLTRMHNAGVSDPHILLTEKPQQASRWGKRTPTDLVNS